MRNTNSTGANLHLNEWRVFNSDLYLVHILKDFFFFLINFFSF